MNLSLKFLNSLYIIKVFFFWALEQEHKKDEKSEHKHYFHPLVYKKMLWLCVCHFPFNVIKLEYDMLLVHRCRIPTSIDSYSQKEIKVS